MNRDNKSDSDIKSSNELIKIPDLTAWDISSDLTERGCQKDWLRATPSGSSSSNGLKTTSAAGGSSCQVEGEELASPQWRCLSLGTPSLLGEQTPGSVTGCRPL